jgi:PAS domain S-box-containing protein
MDAKDDHYRQLLEHVPIGLAYCRLRFESGSPRDFAHLAVNRAYEQLTGIADVIGRHGTVAALDLGRAAPPLLETFAEVSRSGKAAHFETYVEGRDLWLDVSIHPSEPGAFVVVLVDVGERKRAQQALRESEDRFRRIVEQAPIAMAVVGMDGTIEFINQKAIAVFGYEPRDIPHMDRWWLVAYPDEAYRAEVMADWMGRVDVAIHTRSEIVGNEYRVTCKDRSQKTMFISGTIVGDKIFVLFDDITARKRMEQALFESEQHYKMVSELTTDYVYRLGVAADGTLHMDFVSDNFYTLTGRRREDALTVESWGNFMHPEDYQKIRAIIPQMLTGPRSLELELRSFMPGQKERWVSTIVRSDWDEHAGRVTAIVGTVKDITERKLAEQALQESNETLALIFKNSPDSAVITRIADGLVTNVNDRFVGLSGYTREEAIGKTTLELGLFEDPGVRARFMQALRERGRIENLEIVLCGKNGRRVTGLLSSQVVLVQGVPHTYTTVHDITARKATEALLVNAQKLDSLGVLAGGIAHDFNNLLAGIFGYIDLARSVSKDAETTEYLEATMGTLKRAKALSLQLLTFAKGGAPTQKAVSLAPLVHEAAQFALSGSNIACTYALPDDLWLCSIDRNQISQVIDNIVINAQQAMPNGGAIDITARNLTLAAGDHPLLAAGNYVGVSIKDCGIGIPKDVLPRVFDPFYTTKTRGHGLGLATSYSIIKRHGGSIEVESEPGKGSVFHVYLPASGSARAEEETAQAPHHGSGTVIVVDDEAVVRDTLRHMLGALGYRVICEEDGRAVVERCRRTGPSEPRPVAIILDLTIPGGMGGVEAAAELRKWDPSVPLFVASGYADNSAMTDPRRHGFAGSISKPFTIAELSDLLRDVGRA